MTKKHFIKAAMHVKLSNAVSKAEKRRLANTFADFFETENPRFDRDRFLKACEV